VIIQLDPGADAAQLSAIQRELAAHGYKPTEVRTQAGRYLVAIGERDIDVRRIGHLSGVRDVHRVSDAYKLVSRKWKVAPTRIDLGGGAAVGGGSLAIMAGPCSIEDEKLARATATFLASHGVQIMRGGAFKPRTSPYSFRGTGIEGLKMFHAVAREHGIKVISEVLEISQIAQMYDYVDIFQLGTRNSQNFSLLDELGKIDKPVLIKRGMSGTIEELLQSAEYVFSSGNERLLLCERGIRTFERASRNTLDLNAVPILKEKTHLPVVVDPSHGIGVRRFVPAMSLAAVMAGADGLLLEVHPDPLHAASDGAQTLDFAEAGELFEHARNAYKLRTIN
jgi:3-deoxy-7-phosphoheptulonate synthase